MDFQYFAQAPEISDQICTKMDDMLKESHDHKDVIISAGERTGKCSRVIDNWHISKLELLQSVTSNICNNEAPIQWSADTTEWRHVMKIKEPSCSSNNQEYESQICHFLDCANKCQHFNIATAMEESWSFQHSGTENYKEPGVFPGGNLEYSTCTQV